MLTSYLATNLRRLRRFPLQAVTGITCLTVGLAVCLLIGLFLRHELSFDSQHPDADRLYRANWLNVASGARFATFFNPASPLISQALPQVEAFARLMLDDNLVEVDGVRHFPTVSLVDPQFFELFSYPVRTGDPGAIADLSTAVVTEAGAQQLFGRTDVVGETFTVDGRLDFQIAAVVANNPVNSHLVSNLFINIGNVTELFQSPNFWDNLGSDIMYHYLLLAPGADPELVAAAIVDYLAQQSPLPGEFSAQVDVRLQSLRDIHFTTDLQNEMTVRDDITGTIKPHRQWSDLYLFSGVALLTLTIAIFNFVNLQLAMASLRARELGVRRTLGASRSDLVVQFLVETLFMCALALVLAVTLAQLLLPWFNSMVAAPLSLTILFSPMSILTVAVLLLALALLAGSYPAWLMAGLSPVLALRGQVSAGLSAQGFRSGLVMLQFAISIAMVIAAGVVNSQLNYALTKTLGFDPNNVLIVDLGVPEARRAYDTLRSELAAQASIQSVSAGSILPTQSLSDGAILNRITDAGRTEITTRRISVSDDYFQTLGMEFVAGRPLTSSRPGDFMPNIGPDNLEVTGGVIFNETAARAGGWSNPEDAIGQSLFSEFAFGGNSYRMNFTVVGVVADAHYGSVRNDIGPISYALDNNRSSMVIRARDGSLPAAREAMARIWEQTVPGFPLRSLQLREEYAALYASENRTFILFMGLSAVAIIMACFGLYGLASLIAATRRKEISIRKVLGATVRQLMLLLSWRIVRLVLVANLIAWPLAWWVMQAWLTNFAYRTNMDIGLFLFSSALTLVIALLTIGHRAWITAVQSPVHALRSE